MIDLNASVSSRTVTLTFSASDENSTGVRGYYVSSDQNTWTYTTDTNAQFVGLANGTYTFFVKATDFADNNSVDLNVTAIVNVQEGGGDNGGGGGSGGGGGGSGGGTTVAGPPIVVETNTAGPENDEEVNTGSTTEDTLEVTDVPQETTLPPATGAFTAGNNSPNSFWIWFLLLIPAAMWVYAAKRIREQRLAATPTKKKK
jgi:hypothetical protein